LHSGHQNLKTDLEGVKLEGVIMAEQEKDKSIGEILKEEVSEADRILIVAAPDAYLHKKLAEAARKHKGENEVTRGEGKEEGDDKQE
jgi:CO dehydrogenase/acetyl-CoA synthase delta subunit